MSPHPLAELGIILVAAGRGTRLGAARPKAFIEFSGATLLERAVRTVMALPRAGQLVLVVPEGLASEALETASIAEGSHWQVSVVTGGRERHESVRKGLEALADSIETVLVHDAARPLTPVDVFERVIAAVHEQGCGVAPVMPLVDTVKLIDDSGTVRSTVDREHLVAAQTPQGFPREMLAAAHSTAQLHGDTSPASLPSDDAEVVQRAGGLVRTVPGSQLAHKLTIPSDFVVLEALLRADNP